MKCKRTQYLEAEAKARGVQWLEVLMTVVVVVERWLRAGRAAVHTQGFCIILIVSGLKLQELVPQCDIGESH